jgi:hypothetical protein
MYYFGDVDLYLGSCISVPSSSSVRASLIYPNWSMNPLSPSAARVSSNSSSNAPTPLKVMASSSFACFQTS